jgi:hypothetical protein
MWIHITVLISLFILALTLPMLALAQSQSDEERDFIPGEKAVFYDDFTDMTKGAAPPHWKVRGGAAKFNPAGRLVLADRLSLYPNIKTLPKNFTVETDFVPKDASGGHVARPSGEPARGVRKDLNLVSPAVFAPQRRRNSASSHTC